MDGSTRYAEGFRGRTTTPYDDAAAGDRAAFRGRGGCDGWGGGGGWHDLTTKLESRLYITYVDHTQDISSRTDIQT